MFEGDDGSKLYPAYRKERGETGGLKRVETLLLRRRRGESIDYEKKTAYKGEIDRCSRRKGNSPHVQTERGRSIAEEALP